MAKRRWFSTNSYRRIRWSFSYPWYVFVARTPAFEDKDADLLYIATPAHLVFPQIDTEALEAALLPRRTTSSTNAAAEAVRKESTGNLSSLGSKKTIREIVATIDPRVRVDADVDDVSVESPPFSLYLRDLPSGSSLCLS